VSLTPRQLRPHGPSFARDQRAARRSWRQRL